MGKTPSRAGGQALARDRSRRAITVTGTGSRGRGPARPDVRRRGWSAASSIPSEFRFVDTDRLGSFRRPPCRRHVWGRAGHQVRCTFDTVARRLASPIRRSPGSAHRQSARPQDERRAIPEAAVVATWSKPAPHLRDDHGSSSTVRMFEALYRSQSESSEANGSRVASGEAPVTADFSPGCARASARSPPSAFAAASSSRWRSASAPTSRSGLSRPYCARAAPSRRRRLVWIWSTRTDRDRTFFALPDFVELRSE